MMLGAWISVSKNRQKSYEGQIYLHDKEEFEIELFNPLQNSIAIKIKMNGNYISHSMIVIHPGRRVWLERYLDSNNKFKFETYSVDSSDSESVAAIAKNGEIEIELFHEQIILNDIFMLCGNSTGITHVNNLNTTTYTSGIITSSFNCSNYTSDVSLDSMSFMSADLESTKTLETGRVQQGSESNQVFETSNQRFSNYSFKTIKYKLLPISLKPITEKELNISYCPNCRTKIKKSSWKFCPSCGEEL